MSEGVFIGGRAKVKHIQKYGLLFATRWHKELCADDEVERT